MRVILWGDEKRTNIADKLSSNGISLNIYLNVHEHDEKRLVSVMRRHRDWIGTDTRIKGHKINWTYKELIKQPILEIEGYITYPAQFLENLDEFGIQMLINDILRLQERTPQTKTIKLKIKNRWKKSNTINISLESQARINVTMLRLINGVDIYSVMKGWSEREKAAALITWRLAQHNKANDLRLIAEMMENKAKDADPYVNRQTDRT